MATMITLSRPTFFTILFLIVLLPSACRCADPDPLQDFCVANLNASISVNGFPCKPLPEVKSDDFFFDGLSQEGNTTNVFGTNVTSADVLVFPGLNTLGLSVNRVDFAPGGLNPPHIHPRASETSVVIKGKLLVGFVTTGNVLHSKVLKAGEMFVIPRGLMHFQLNVGKGKALFLAAFNSQEPGIVILPTTLFVSTPPIPNAVLTKAFQIDEKNGVRKPVPKWESGFVIGEMGRSVVATEKRFAAAITEVRADELAIVSSMVTAKLIEKNYLAWKDQILTLIENIDLLNHIADEVKEPKQLIITDGTEETNPAYVSWRRDDQLLRSLISGTLTEEVHTFIIGLKTARELWVCLAETFAGASQERELRLICPLQTLRKGNQCVTEYLKSVKIICDELYAIQNPVSDREKVFWTVNGLGPKFDSFADAIMAHPPTPMFSQLSASLLICKKPGHDALRCWHRFNHSYQAEEIPQVLAAMSITDPHDLGWIPDTGATSHMTNNPGILSSVSPYSGSDKIIVGNGNELSISHISNTSLSTSYGNLKGGQISLSTFSEYMPDMHAIDASTSTGFVINSTAATNSTNAPCSPAPDVPLLPLISSTTGAPLDSVFENESGDFDVASTAAPYASTIVLSSTAPTERGVHSSRSPVSLDQVAQGYANHAVDPPTPSTTDPVPSTDTITEHDHAAPTLFDSPATAS
ncbi:hypothetical protein HHK36_006336 [Tetracentron sinense]|uniref:Cupin type-1 domain-containing protein n=1 Tax=Tetracentron sinense TaxID=13715 RepID=A0A835DP40_TETSI|nr:hypothetical protein HHK36_006336 [Tetracentron sinense]